MTSPDAQPHRTYLTADSEGGTPEYGRTRRTDVSGGADATVPTTPDASDRITAQLDRAIEQAGGSVTPENAGYVLEAAAELAGLGLRATVKERPGAHEILPSRIQR